MVLLSCSPTESTAMYFHGFTATRQTTQRSTAPPGHVTQQPLTTINRVLIANINNLGKCPCPRCLVQLGEAQDLGKAIDRQRRDDIRQPTNKLFRIIKKARKAIFQGFKVSGPRVERFLEGGSRVAVNVGHATTTLRHVMLINMGCHNFHNFHSFYFSKSEAPKHSFKS